MTGGLLGRDDGRQAGIVFIHLLPACAGRPLGQDGCDEEMGGRMAADMPDEFVPGRRVKTIGARHKQDDVGLLPLKDGGQVRHGYPCGAQGDEHVGRRGHGAAL